MRTTVLDLLLLLILLDASSLLLQVVFLNIAGWVSPFCTPPSVARVSTFVTAPRGPEITVPTFKMLTVFFCTCPFLPCPRKEANATLGAYWLWRVKAQGKREVPRQQRPNRCVRCSMGIIRNMGGQRLPLSAGRSCKAASGLHGGDRLYPEGTREPGGRGLKRGDVRALCFRRILLVLWGMSQRGKPGLK